MFPNFGFHFTFEAIQFEINSEIKCSVYCLSTDLYLGLLQLISNICLYTYMELQHMKGKTSVAFSRLTRLFVLIQWTPFLVACILIRCTFLLLSKHICRALQHADVILLLGARLNWILHFGQSPRFSRDVKFIQVWFSLVYWQCSLASHLCSNYLYHYSLSFHILTNFLI